MFVYVTTAVGLFASHAVLSAPGVRPALVRRLGRAGFTAVYSLISTLTLLAFVWAYARVDENAFLYAPLADGAAVAVFGMPLAFLLVAGRLLTPFGDPAAPNPPRGVYRVTRFPGSLGLLVWTALHLAATGDLRRVVLFGTMAAIALFAMAKNDWVLRRADSAAACRFRAGTSVVPFAAILRGRQRLALGEIGWRVPAAGLAGYAALLLLHPYLFGIDPLYWFG